MSNLLSRSSRKGNFMQTKIRFFLLKKNRCIFKKKCYLKGFCSVTVLLSWTLLNRGTAVKPKHDTNPPHYEKNNNQLFFYKKKSDASFSHSDIDLTQMTTKAQVITYLKVRTHTVSTLITVTDLQTIRGEWVYFIFHMKF